MKANHAIIIGEILTGLMALLPGGGGILPYMGYIGMCHCEGYGFQTVYSRIGYIRDGPLGNLWGGPKYKKKFAQGKIK